MVAAHTGMRRGEVLGVTWRDLDLDANRLSVRQAVITVEYQVTIADVKTGTARRTIDLDERTVDALRAWRLVREQEAALAGLSRAPRLLSFEFLAGRMASAGRCLDRLEAIASWTWNLSIGESLELEWPDFVPRDRLAAWLAARAGEDFSGDIYARLEGPGR